MARFAYKGVDQSGHTISDEMEGENREAVLRRLHGMGYHVLKIVDGGQAGPKAPARRHGKGAKLDDLAAVSRELAIMTGAGVPLAEALASIAEHLKPGGMSAAVAGVRSDIVSGKSFSAALEAREHVFGKMYGDMAKTAEGSGNLDAVLDQAATYIERSLELKRKIMSALMYPIILAGISVAVVAFMIVFVLPRFSALFERMEVPIPLTTRILLGAGTFATSYWYLCIGCIGLLVSGCVYSLRMPKTREWIDSKALSLPVVGDLARKVVVSRSMMSLGTLLSNNVPLLTALDNAAQTARNPRVSGALVKVKGDVERGRAISESLSESGEFPPLVTQMISVGERTGKLSEILLRVSDYYERDVDLKLKGLTAVIEPIMIVAMGLIVGFIAVSIISPIYALVGSVH
jgi:type IV pilus assembly protein PilC